MRGRYNTLPFFTCFLSIRLVNEQAAHTGNRSTANSAAAAALRTARWEDTKEAVERDVAMAKSQTEILNDMVSNFKKGNSNSDKVFFEDLATQMVQLRCVACIVFFFGMR